MNVLTEKGYLAEIRGESIEFSGKGELKRGLWENGWRSGKADLDALKVTPFVIDGQEQLVKALDTALTATGKVGRTKKAQDAFQESLTISAELQKMLAYEPREIFYCCCGEFTGDRAHHWSPDTKKEANVTETLKLARNFRNIHESEIPVGYKPTDRICADHAKTIYKMTPETLREAVVKAPDFSGWTVSLDPDRFLGNQGWIEYPAVTVSAPPDVPKISIQTIFFEEREEKLSSYTYVASGHTTFKTTKGDYSFDRRGVDDSFYLKLTDGPEEFLATFREQLKKIEATRARHANAVTVPGFSALVSPEQKTEIIEKLRSGKAHEFRPAGFGTGYKLSLRQHSRWDKRAKPETEAFFGVSPIFIEETDCD